MIKAKIVESWESCNSFENALNSELENIHDYGHSILDVKYSNSEIRNFQIWSAMIIYDEKQEP